MHRNAITIPLRFTSDPLATARAIQTLRASVRYEIAMGRPDQASLLTLALLAVAQGDFAPAVACPVSA